MFFVDIFGLSGKMYCLKQLVEHFFPMSWEDDVVIADGIVEEVGSLRFVVEAYDLLCATHIVFCLTAQEFSLCHKTAFEVSRDFEDSDGAVGHISANTYADARLEVGVKFVAFAHIERYGAVGKEYLARFGIDACRIGLKTRHAC